MNRARSKSYSNLDCLISVLDHGSAHTILDLTLTHKPTIADILPDYRLRALKYCTDDIVLKTYEFMKHHFAESSETYQWFIYSTKYCAYDYFIIQDISDNVVAFSSSQYLRLRSDPDKRSIIAIWYIATDETHRGQGLARCLYRAIYKNGLDIARRRRHEIFAIIGEVVENAEGFLNSMGRKRLYQRVSGVWRELYYENPPLDMDPETGAATGRKDTEHLMMQLLDGRDEVSINDIHKIVGTIYVEYLGKTGNYFSYKAYRNAKEYIWKMKKEFYERLLEGDGNIALR